MKNYEERYLIQAVDLLECIDLDNYNNEPQTKTLMDDIKKFLQSYEQYQCQKDEKMYGDL